MADKFETGSAAAVEMAATKKVTAADIWPERKPAADSGDRFQGDTEKHLAGGKFDHDQVSHGFRYGPNMSFSRLRRMARQDPERYADYKGRTRARAAQETFALPEKIRRERNQARRELQALHKEYTAKHSILQAESDRWQDEIMDLNTKNALLWQEYRKHALSSTGDRDKQAELMAEIDRLKEYRHAVVIPERERALSAINELAMEYRNRGVDVLRLEPHEREDIQFEITELNGRKFSETQAADIAAAFDQINSVVRKGVVGDNVIRISKLNSKDSEYYEGLHVSDEYQAGSKYPAGIIIGGWESTYWTRKVLAHEMGHEIEDKPGIAGATAAWRDQHATRGKPHSFYGGPYYERKSGSWINDYAGMIYEYRNKTVIRSEMISVGLEMFFVDPLGFAAKDPELFDLIFAVVRGGFSETTITLKHLAGGKFDHDQVTHGYRYGANMSFSRARRMARQDPERWADYKSRARARAAGGSSKPVQPAADIWQQASAARQKVAAMWDQRESVRESYNKRADEIQKEISRLWTVREQIQNDMAALSDNATDAERQAINDRIKAVEDQNRALNAERYQLLNVAHKELGEQYRAKAHEELMLPEGEHATIRVYMGENDAGRKLPRDEQKLAEETMQQVQRFIHKDIAGPNGEADLAVRPKDIKYQNNKYTAYYRSEAYYIEDVAGVYMGDIKREHGWGQSVIVKKDEWAGTFAHEVGHWVEYSGKNAHVTKAWVDRYCDPVDWGRPRGNEGKFTPKGRKWGIWDYAGTMRRHLAHVVRPPFRDRLLQGSTLFTTELISVGLEMFFKDPILFARKEPDLFEMVFAVLRGGGLEGNVTFKELLTEKHLAGGKFDHDQVSHGYRYGANMSTSRARRMARQDPERWADYKKRARARAAGGSSPSWKDLTSDQAIKQLKDLYTERNRILSGLSARRPLLEKRMKEANDQAWETRNQMMAEKDPDRKADLTQKTLVDQQRAVEASWALKEFDAEIDNERSALIEKERDLLRLPEGERANLQVEFWRKMGGEELSPKAKAAVERGLEEANSLLHKDVLSAYEQKYPVGPAPKNNASAGFYANPEHQYRSGHGIYFYRLMRDKDIVTTIIHEFGHHIEAEGRGDLISVVKAWREKHTDRSVYKYHGKGKNYRRVRGEQWITEYAGNEYRYTRGRRLTETISVGFENYFEDPGLFATKDPELFALIFSILRGGYAGTGVKEYTEKHLAGGQYDHDQSSHGRRSGSESGARRAAARDQAAWDAHQARVQQLTPEGVKNKRSLSAGSSSEVFEGTMGDGSSVVVKPLEDLVYMGFRGEQFWESGQNGAEFDVAAGDISASLGYNAAPAANVVGGSQVKDFVPGQVLMFSDYPGGRTGTDKFIEAVDHVQVVDAILGQRDGHEGNYIITDDGGFMGIDYNISGFSDHDMKPASIQTATYLFRNRRNLDPFDDVSMGKYYDRNLKGKVKVTRDRFLDSDHWLITAKTARALLAKGPDALKFSKAVPRRLQAKLRQRLARLLNEIKDQGEPIDGHYFLRWP